MEAIVKKAMFDLLTIGDQYGMDCSEGLWRPFINLPEGISNIDELIKYGVELLNNISDENIIENIDKRDYNEDWSDALRQSSIWPEVFNKIIPSLQCITGDCSHIDEKIDEYRDMIIKESDKISSIRDDIIFEEGKLIIK